MSFMGCLIGYYKNNHAIIPVSHNYKSSFPLLKHSG